MEFSEKVELNEMKLCGTVENEKIEIEQVESGTEWKME